MNRTSLSEHTLSNLLTPFHFPSVYLWKLMFRSENKGKVIFNVLSRILIKNHLKQFAPTTTEWTLNVILTPFVLALVICCFSSSFGFFCRCISNLSTYKKSIRGRKGMIMFTLCRSSTLNIYCWWKGLKLSFSSYFIICSSNLSVSQVIYSGVGQLLIFFKAIK